MRYMALVLLIGCGGAPSFAPVVVKMQDATGRPAVSVVVEHKLNQDCTSNCEMGKTIADGGCSTIRIDSQGSHCEGVGNTYLAIIDAPADAGVVTSPTRELSVGAQASFVVLPGTEESCRQSYFVPAQGLTISIVRSSSGTCSITSTSP